MGSMQEQEVAVFWRINRDAIRVKSKCQIHICPAQKQGWLRDWISKRAKFCHTLALRCREQPSSMLVVNSDAPSFEWKCMLEASQVAVGLLAQAKLFLACNSSQDWDSRFVFLSFYALEAVVITQLAVHKGYCYGKCDNMVPTRSHARFCQIYNTTIPNRNMRKFQ